MDKLYNAAQFYKENLLNKQFRLIAAKKGQVIELDIFFSKSEFKHLLGLHKLNDLPEIQTTGSAILYKQILDKEITFLSVSKSLNFTSCETRLSYFEDIQLTLNATKLIIRSLKGSFNSIRADYMLTYKSEDHGYAHLFLKEDIQNKCSPVTFIVNEDNRYLQNNPDKWTVLSIEEVDQTDDRNVFVEIRPQRILKQNDKAVMITLPDSRHNISVWLSNKVVVLNNANDKVMRIQKNLQNKYLFPLPVGRETET